MFQKKEWKPSRNLSLALLLTFTSYKALAQDSCERATALLCGQDQRSAACLEALYSCGSYDSILGRFTGQLQGLTLEEQYFAGVSYLGIADRQKAQSIKCFYNGQGKLALGSFLGKMKEAIGKQGFFVDAQLLRYTHHATKELGNARKVAGCLEDGYTQFGINTYAQNYAEAAIKASILQANSDSTSVLAEPIKELQKDIQGFVTTASQVETQLALSQQEIDFANHQLTEVESRIASEVGSIDGGMGSGGQPVFNTALLRGIRQRLTAPIAQVQAKDTEFVNLFEECRNNQDKEQNCADIFAANRQANIQAARSIISQSTNLGRFFESSFSNPQHAFAKFVLLKDARPEQKLPVGTIKEKTLAIWKNYGVQAKACSDPGKWWFCQLDKGNGVKP